ncbi:MAG: (deoxy)nucleoside triphosphate pyrophosphohydrolase [Deltaproteobacteria bacterium]|nr:(deoxy)nucleoside triphosphate pyrophosphohydrolase [Deltaproteobacteria bacterium]
MGDTGNKKTIRVVAAIVRRQDKYLITQRRPNATLPLLWEFPGGKVETGEDDETALKREFRERLDAEIRVGKLARSVRHQYDAYTIELHAYDCELVSEGLKPVRVNDYRWVLVGELDQYQFPGADQATVEKLVAEFNN